MTVEQGVRAAPVWQVGVSVQAPAPGSPPVTERSAPGCLLYNTSHSFCPPPKRNTPLLCCRGTETSVTSSSTHISSPSSDPNHPYPSTAAPLCLWLTVSTPAKTCHPSHCGSLYNETQLKSEIKERKFPFDWSVQIEMWSPFLVLTGCFDDICSLISYSRNVFYLY